MEKTPIQQMAVISQITAWPSSLYKVDLSALIEEYSEQKIEILEQ
jgi:hypothetical protein